MAVILDLFGGVTGKLLVAIELDVWLLQLSPEQLQFLGTLRETLVTIGQLKEFILLCLFNKINKFIKWLYVLYIDGSDYRKSGS